MLRASLAVCVLLAAAPSCPDLYSLGAHGFTAPTIETRGAHGAPLGNGVSVAVAFFARNPNAYPLELSGIDYDVAVKGVPAFSGTQGELSVSEHGEGTVDLAGVIDASSPVLRNLRVGELAAYTVTGVVHVKTPAGVRADVEFSTGGTFVVPPGAH